MQTASSANRTCSELRSASEYTATVEMPSSLHAQMTRRAISPRLATRIFWNIGRRRRLLLPARTDAEQRLPVFDGLSVFDEDAQHFAADVGFDFVPKLYGFHDTQGLPGFDVSATFHGGFGARAGRAVVRAHDRRLHQVKVVAGPRFGRGHSRRRRHWWRRSRLGVRASAGHNDFRRGQLLRNADQRPGGGLLQPNFQIAVRVFELLEVVLAHVAKQLLDILEFGGPYRGASSRFRGLFTFHAFVKSQ